MKGSGRICFRSRSKSKGSGWICYESEEGNRRETEGFALEAEVKATKS